MAYKKILLNEIEHLPEAISKEVLDFIRFLKQKNRLEAFDTALVSEPVLARDWLTPAEDEAWQDL